MSTLILVVGCGRSSFDFEVQKELEDLKPSLDKSWMTVTTPQPADGITPSLVTIKMVSASGKALAGVSMDLEVSGSDNVIVPCSLSDSAGLMSCRVYSTKAEMKSVKASGLISFESQTQFESVTPTLSVTGVSSMGSFQRTLGGYYVTVSAGQVESPFYVKDSMGTTRLRSSLLGVMLVP